MRHEDPDEIILGGTYQQARFQVRACCGASAEYLPDDRAFPDRHSS